MSLGDTRSTIKSGRRRCEPRRGRVSARETDQNSVRTLLETRLAGNGRLEGALTMRLRAKIFKDRSMYVRYVSDLIRDRATAEISGGSYHPVTRELLLTKNASLDGTLLVLFHEGLHQYFDTFFRVVSERLGSGSSR